VDLEHKVAAVVSRQERKGFKLDVTKAISLVATWKEVLSTIKEELQSIFPPLVTDRVSKKTFLVGLVLGVRSAGNVGLWI
jgi:hypothetical protein